MYQNELELLGYTEKWLESGILSPNRLIREAKEFQSPNRDPYTEHYRVATLYDFLGQGRALTDAEINDFLWLAYEDDDKTMAYSAILALMKYPELSDEQFEALPTHPIIELFDTSKTYLRHRLLRSIEREGLTISVVDDCLKNGDNTVHRCLLEFELERVTLEGLTEMGATKAVRNIAQTRLKQNKYRSEK